MQSLFALKATGNVALVGISGFTASMTNVTVEINQGRGLSARAADFSTIGLHIATGATTRSS